MFYQITQDFVNNDRDYLQASDMELYLTDLSSTRSTYDFGGITTLSERFDSDDPLSLYRLLILPWKEKGTKITVFYGRDERMAGIPLMGPAFLL